MSNEINQAMFIEEYAMVHAFNPQRLTDEVNHKLEQGFVPYGPAFGSNNGGQFQPMVKYNEELTRLFKVILKQTLSDL